MSAVLDAAGGGRVPPVAETVHKDVGHAASAGQFHHRVEVLQQRVDADVTGQTHHVQPAPAGQAPVHGGVQLGIGEKRAVADGFGDAPGILIYDASRSNVLVPDLAVAHRPFGQTYVEPAGLDQRERPLATQHVVDWRLRHLDRIRVVPLRVGILPPAVTYDQNERADPWNYCAHQTLPEHAAGLRAPATADCMVCLSTRPAAHHTPAMNHRRAVKTIF